MRGSGHTKFNDSGTKVVSYLADWVDHRWCLTDGGVPARRTRSPVVKPTPHIAGHVHQHRRRQEVGGEDEVSRDREKSRRRADRANMVGAEMG